MKEGTFMAQTLLSKVKARLSQLDKMKKELKNTETQLSKKEQEICDFYRDWKLNCPHAFYRVQRLQICTFFTVGYYCCLCGKYQRAQYPQTTLSRYHGARDTYIQADSQKKARPPMEPPADINAPNFIGTVVESVYANADGKDEEDHYPIPPEYQAEVDRKNEQLHKLEAEKGKLEKKLQELKNSIKLSETELKDVTHLLNNYFGYPETIIRAPIHWGPDDFNYDG